MTNSLNVDIVTTVSGHAAQYKRGVVVYFNLRRKKSAVIRSLDVASWTDFDAVFLFEGRFSRVLIYF